MVRCCLVLLAACGAASGSIAVSGAVHVNSSLDEAPTTKPPEVIDLHLHETPSYVADLDKLYVQVTSDDKHGDLLIRSATAGLASTDYVVAVDDGGDVELNVEVESLVAEPQGTTCRLKIFVLRMPQHDLLAIADGGAQVTGHRRNPTEDCLSMTGTAIVQQKLPLLFQKQLEAKQ
jgi:hypothetical protein